MQGHDEGEMESPSVFPGFLSGLSVLRETGKRTVGWCESVCVCVCF